MKFKLVEYPYGREMGFNQDKVWFIQGTDDNKTWYNYMWNYYTCSPYIMLENKEFYTRTPPSTAYVKIEDANKAFDKIIAYYKQLVNEKPINILREVEI